MTTGPYQTTGGYGAGSFNPTTQALIVDPNDNIVPAVPQPNPSGATGGATAGYIATNTQVLTAILMELRVISNLLNMNTASVDLAALRSDEAVGSSGGVLN